MKLPRARSGWLPILVAVLFAQAACQRQASPPAVSTPAATSTPTAAPTATATPDAASDPHAAVTPQSHDLPASAAKSPADGSTAIGGMAGNPQAAPPATGTAPAPTAGDGAASAPK